jgi:cytochrome c553
MNRLAAWLVAAACGAGQAAPALAVPSESAQRGAALFRTYCVACHGAEGAGCGPRAMLYRPRPANLTASTRSADYKARIIREGGAAMNRSAFMPPWGDELSAGDIADLLAHLASLPRQPEATC